MRVVFVAAVFALLLLTAVEARRPKWHQLDGYNFKRYVKDFGKAYENDAEFDRRKLIFEKNLATIRAHNAGHSSYKMGVNQFADRSKDELLTMNGARPHAMHSVKQQLLKKPHVRQYKSSDAPLPLSVDWRLVSPSVLSAVKDQGQCGSCWAHGSTENIETYYAIATGQMFALSQQEITACAPNPNDCGGTGGCGGSIAELAFEYVVEHGIAQEWSNPYTAFYGTTGTCSNNTSPMVWLDGYVKLPANDQYAVMDALAHTGPLSVNVDASTWFLYDSGIFDGCNYKNNITIDHVVQLVGYGTDPALGMDYWLIRNSWNPTYGENGYIRIRRTPNAECGWDVMPQQGTACNGAPPQLWVCGECGIVFDTSYPIVQLPS